MAERTDEPGATPNQQSNDAPALPATPLAVPTPAPQPRLSSAPRALSQPPPLLRASQPPLRSQTPPAMQPRPSQAPPPSQRASQVPPSRNSQLPRASQMPNPITQTLGGRGDADDPFVGQTINERIRIVRTIARGGMGKVYLAEQIALGRTCAVKILDPRLVGSDASEFNKRFLLEASISAKLTHPNVVKIFDYGDTDDGVCWLAMEYLEGSTLSQELEKNGRLAPERVISIAQQICRALREAHALGVVHRDMKPGNVFLVKGGDDDGDFAKVLDFGLVKSSAKSDGDDGQHLTQVGQIMGSPKYMAPEQSQGHDVDARADIYSLGATIFAMITGRAPFEKVNAIATMMAHMSEPVPRLASVIPDVMLPVGLQEIIDRCMAKDKEQRFASMDEVLAALKGYHVPGAPANTGSRPVMVANSLEISGMQRPASSRTPLIVGALIVAVGIVAVLAVNKSRDPSGGASASGGVTPTAPNATGAPVVPSATASVVAPPPPPVATATVEIATEPPGARVKEDGLEVCAATPCKIKYTGDAAEASVEHLLVITKPEYKVENKLVKTGAGSLSVKLSKIK